MYDSGTTSGVAGANDKNILFDVQEEHVLLEGVGGHKSVSKEYGYSIFENTRKNPEEPKLILPMMKNFLKKLKLDNSFDEYKVRDLMRGDLQHEEEVRGMIPEEVKQKWMRLDKDVAAILLAITGSTSYNLCRWMEP